MPLFSAWAIRPVPPLHSQWKTTANARRAGRSEFKSTHTLTKRNADFGRAVHRRSLSGCRTRTTPGRLRLHRNRSPRLCPSQSQSQTPQTRQLLLPHQPQQARRWRRLRQHRRPLRLQDRRLSQRPDRRQDRRPSQRPDRRQDRRPSQLLCRRRDLLRRLRHHQLPRQYQRLRLRRPQCLRRLLHHHHYLLRHRRLLRHQRRSKSRRPPMLNRKRKSR